MNNSNNNLKAALLPLYIELYDTHISSARARMESFLQEVTDKLELNGITILKLPICRVKEEFDKAVKKAEVEGVHAIITLHLAYSPSLESVNALAKTNLPIIVMDTTPTFNFSSMQSPDEILYNHGIHGVQDMCNLLTRNNKHYSIEVGHMDNSNIVKRITRRVMSAKMVSVLRNSRTGRIGSSFKGMGDFVVKPEVVSESIGTTVVEAEPLDLEKYLPDENDSMVEEELKNDYINFDVDEIDSSVHRHSVRNGLALRRWIEEEKLNAFSINFMEISQGKGLSIMPFLEISKLLSKGIGYAGEGDVITASVVSALFSVFKDVTFTEMFCPDWENGAVFMTHMGEMNIAVSSKKPKLSVMPWRFSNSNDTMFATACFKEGKAVLVNLAPTGDNSFSLILSPVTMLPEDDNTPFTNKVRGWMKPDMPLPEFLKRYTQLAGTHHSVLVYTEDIDIIAEFGNIMGWNVHHI